VYESSATLPGVSTLHSPLRVRSNAGARTIALPDDLADTLRERRALIAAEDDLVFEARLCCPCSISPARRRSPATMPGYLPAPATEQRDALPGRPAGVRPETQLAAAL